MTLNQLKRKYLAEGKRLGYKKFLREMAFKKDNEWLEKQNNLRKIKLFAKNIATKIKINVEKITDPSFHGGRYEEFYLIYIIS